MNFFTADLHFGHANIIKYCKRPFADVAAMDRALIANWNSRVRADDDVWILGDFTMQAAQGANNYLRQLKGRKHLILGNHDNFAHKPKGSELLEEVCSYKELKLQTCPYTAILCHYPILFWNGSHNGTSIMLYGHIHNSFAPNAVTALLYNALNVGVDCCGYIPLSEKEVLTRIAEHNQAMRYSLNNPETQVPLAELARLHHGESAADSKLTQSN